MHPPELTQLGQGCGEQDDHNAARTPYLFVKRPLCHSQTQRSHGHAMSARASSPEFTQALRAAAFGASTGSG